MSKGITPDKLAEALEREFTGYSDEVEDKIIAVVRKNMTTLVKKTKATAPKGKRGKFSKQIAGDFSNLKKGTRNPKAVWYVKAPDHRLTHLLVHGHATKDGGRTKADPFLQNALDEVLPEFEREVEEALKGD